MTVCFSTALAQDALRFPYRALIFKDGARIYSGPDHFYYATDTLKQGSEVVVVRHHPDGWCGIEPPAGSFNLVPASAVELADSESGIVVVDGVEAWVGTHLGDVDRPRGQVMLNVNDRVKVLGELSWPTPEDQLSTWYQISPPTGELRWVHISDLQLPAPPMESPQFNSDVGQPVAANFDQHMSPTADYADQEYVADSMDLCVSEDSANFDWLNDTRVGYDNGFLIASQNQLDLRAGDLPFQLRLNGWGQIRQTYFESQGTSSDANQFQLKRARLIFSGSAFTPDFSYFFQLDGRSSSGDDVRLLDYQLTYDLGHHRWGLDRGTFGFRTGKYKMPFHMARWLSGREFEFSDRSMASTFFDVNRSLAWGLYGHIDRQGVPIDWETAIFNGLVTGGAETGSSGALDSNFAYSGRLMCYPTGEWGASELADLECHTHLATRMGAGFANSTIDRSGNTEFDSIRVVDSGSTLASILPRRANQYTVSLYSVDASLKYQGWSFTTECYFRQINEIRGASVPDLFDYGYWMQLGKFVVPGEFEIMTRWSRVIGDSGTLGANNESASEIAGGFVRYFRGQNAKFTFDFTYLDGAPINSASLDITPGDIGWLYRSQIQFAF